jgi:hypothetical protein
MLEDKKTISATTKAARKLREDKGVADSCSKAQAVACSLRRVDRRTLTATSTRRVVVADTGGLHKAHCTLVGVGKGKSGGLRVIYPPFRHKPMYTCCSFTEAALLP